MGKIFLFLADGFEEIEALGTVDILRRAELEVQTVSIMDAFAVKGAHGVEVLADSKIEDTKFENIDMLVLPGGMPGASNLSNDSLLRQLILDASKKQIPLAAICAAPLVYGRLGLLEGKKATCYPGFESELKGALLQEASVVVDGELITANGPGATFEFGYAIIAYFCGDDKVADLKAEMMVKR